MQQVQFTIDRSIIIIAIVFLFMLTIAPYLIAQYLMLTRVLNITQNIEPILLGQSLVLLGVFIFIILIIGLGVILVNSLNAKVVAQAKEKLEKTNHKSESLDDLLYTQNE